jgi:integrase
VLRVLTPLWQDKTETANRVRNRIESVLDFAKAQGWREGDNAARWRGHLDHLLPSKRKVAKAEHYAAMPWKDVPAFIAKLRTDDTVPSLALQFLIFTACRTGEALGATWSAARQSR